MYALTIIETDTSYEARIARIMLETAGYPAIMATIGLADDPDSHAVLFTAPSGTYEGFTRAIKMYAELGERGVQFAMTVAASPEGQILAQRNPHAVPADKRDAIRNALLHTLYTVSHEEHIAVVTSEPNYSTVPEPVADAPTIPVTRDPVGGGFDGYCIGVDAHDTRKSNRDSSVPWRQSDDYNGR